MRLVGVFGGTFDPIHDGHLRPALELRDSLGLDEVRFIPCRIPPHRQAPVASAQHRAQMVRKAIEGIEGFVLDQRELRRGGPSYTVETLKELKTEFGSETRLVLLLGMDAFLGLPEWHEWQTIFEMAHVAVAHRPGWRADARGPIGALLAHRRVTSPQLLRQKSEGCICLITVTQLEISATALRELIVRGRDIRFLVPEVVREFISEKGCYQRD